MKNQSSRRPSSFSSPAQSFEKEQASYIKKSPNSLIYKPKNVIDNCNDSVRSKVRQNIVNATSKTIDNDNESGFKASTSNRNNVKNLKDAFINSHSETSKNTRKELIMQRDENNFAKTLKMCSENSTLLEEEASPTDSLISSDSTDAIPRRQKEEAEFKAINEEMEKNTENLEDTSNPELMDLISPVTPGTPTHVSNSLSLSDDGNKDEFLIDDEICDQPQLIFNERGVKRGSKNIYSQNNVKSNNVPTHSEDSTFSPIRFKPQNKSPNRIASRRAESYMSLSLHDSISSDDLMGDFEGSLDSIDR